MVPVRQTARLLAVAVTVALVTGAVAAQPRGQRGDDSATASVGLADLGDDLRSVASARGRASRAVDEWSDTTATITSGMAWDWLDPTMPVAAPERTEAAPAEDAPAADAAAADETAPEVEAAPVQAPAAAPSTCPSSWFCFPRVGIAGPIVPYGDCRGTTDVGASIRALTCIQQLWLAGHAWTQFGRITGWRAGDVVFAYGRAYTITGAFTGRSCEPAPQPYAPLLLQTSLGPALCGPVLIVQAH